MHMQITNYIAKAAFKTEGGLSLVWEEGGGGEGQGEAAT